MTRTSLMAASAVLLLVVGSAAMAGDGMRGEMGARGFGGEALDFAAIDANGDGKLDRSELLARSTARIAEIDADADGSVTRAELVAAFPAHGGAWRVFSRDPGEERADRMLAMLGGTEAGAVPTAAFAEHRVNMLLSTVDTDRDDAISVAEHEAIGMHGGRGRGHDGPRGAMQH